MDDSSSSTNLEEIWEEALNFYAKTTGQKFEDMPQITVEEMGKQISSAGDTNTEQIVKGIMDLGQLAADAVTLVSHPIVTLSP